MSIASGERAEIISQPTGPPVPPPKRGIALRWPRLTLILALLFILAGAALSGGITDALKNGGFDDPKSDSVAATKLLDQKFPASQPNLVILSRAKSGGIDGAAARADGEKLLAALKAESGVQIVASYFSQPNPALKSTDGNYGGTFLRIAGDDDAVADVTKRLHDKVAGDRDGTAVTFGGIAQINNDMNAQLEQDFALTEVIALPLTFLLLFFVFRGFIAALLPLVIGIFSIFGSLAFLTVLGQVTSISVFALNLVTALGLGLAIDYSLLIVARYREERERGLVGVAAVTATMRTAGRTVAFSAVIVAAVLLTMLVFDQFFLRSFAYAGLAVVAITALGALVPLPAALLLLGDRIDKWSLRRRNPEKEPANRLWGRIAGISMRFPAVFGIAGVALFVLMALPMGHLQVNIPDERVLPKTTESRVVVETLRAQFPEAARQINTLPMVAPNWPGSGEAEIGQYAAALSRLDGVTMVNTGVGQYVDGAVAAPAVPELAATFRSGESVYIEVLNDVVAYSPAGRDLVENVRAVPVPGGQTVYVGGLAAQLDDVASSIGSRLPWAIGLVVLLTFVLLTLATGSLIMPLKAILLNVLGLGAMLGAMVWIFQDGNLADLLGFTPSPLAVAMPILLICVAYALSMDYEMFLISRVKEVYEETGDPVRAVREGLGKSGSIVSAAAIILAVTFFATALSGVAVAKLFGVGAGLAVILDATVIRGLLVPAFLKLVGHGAFWAPGWVKKINRRFASSIGH
ncbi:MMPL family transporter [Micromonospora sp. RTGN7]|uniref:MMPL family transporter n=1 Tax=Micromonospora sp. RTGN7 TaxID=3016526 RepID=UPI0029FEF120|nr:MMPL family transporter [Micromonospora sp. RTGN7]